MGDLTVVKEFVTALQFLTRFQLVNQSECDNRTFGRSVRFFVLAGVVAGSVLAMMAIITAGWLPGTVRSALLLVVSVGVTGGLHCDGLMDTADGVLSGRSRERMLEIMKDSRVGAFGVIAIALLFILKWSLLYDMPDLLLPYSLVSMMAIARLAMTFSILFFPYARSEGMGKAFAEYAGKSAMLTAILTQIGVLLTFYFLGGFFTVYITLAATVGALCFAFLLGRWFTRLLGGLTGDTYGAITELCEVLTLMVFVLAAYIK